ncbi:MAG: 50S ribosomal protein L25/general stress protein Ctc [Alphaproteobacteria bacterium]|jgi:large subunit ribosomal protein L25|uniref:50S ribosomal protein L25/general stress protein Ctc n=1 Tax=Pacificispira sp. TaxID=2888761 RepID=UPI001AFF029B|nr:50S ribosomal protein L25/general stress protein Ctc [Alphaproteobacteria bacterium]MBO6864299.1 50S ribosomal protein L25/general stress protein Ctc [Alphaproteobacteria bacterium]
MAEEAIFPAKARERAGKGAARAVRREGLVPGVVYGDNKDPLTIAVDPRHIMKQLEMGLLFNTIYTVDVEGGAKEKALPRDVQFHPVTDAPLHIDFMRLRKGSKINVNIPVTFINEEASPGIDQGGILNVTRDEVELMCPVDDIPHEVVCDLTGTQIGDTIRISMVTLPEGVEPVIQDRDFVVANISSPSISEPVESDDEDEDVEEATDGEEEAESEE